MDLKGYQRFRSSLRKILEVMERIEDATEKELIEAGKDWADNSENIINQLCIKKLELRKQ